jgi:hypothetical protein
MNKKSGLQLKIRVNVNKRSKLANVNIRSRLANVKIKVYV